MKVNLDELYEFTNSHEFTDLRKTVKNMVIEFDEDSLAGETLIMKLIGKNKH